MKIVKMLSLLALVASLFSVNADNVAPSQTPPGGLAVNKVPQFVVIGFDDNSDAASMQWILDFMRSKTNQNGLGNSKTYDGSPARVSFYTNTRSAFDSLGAVPELISQLTQAINDGHEIGNHTATHQHGRTFTAAQWASEISICTNDMLAKGIISSKSQIKGFRTPFLEYGDVLYQGLKDSGFVYDCSIEEGSQADHNGTNFLWPYTLDTGSPGHEASWLANAGNPNAFHLTGTPGLWEMPNHNVVIPPDDQCAAYGAPTGLRERTAYRLNGGNTTAWWYQDIIANGKMTGFDYNMWAKFELHPDTSYQAAMSKSEFLAVLKYTLDLRLSGNRAPFMFGAHTQYYSASANTSYPNATDSQRREAIEEFIDYALSKSDVRVVPAYKIIEWCRAPIALDNVSSTTYSLTVTNGTGTGTYAEGASVSISANAAAAGKQFDKWTGDVATVANVNSSSTTITMGTTALTVVATYKDAVGPDTLNPSVNFTTFAVGDTTDWHVGSVDGLGSTGTVVKSSATVVKADFTFSPVDTTKGDDGYAYGNIAFYDEEGNFTNVNYIKVTYKSTGSLNLELVQSTFEWGSHATNLPAATGFTTKLIKVDTTNFKQSEWAPLKAALDMSKMSGVSFEPNAIAETGETVSFEISELVFYGYAGTPIMVFTPKSFSTLAIGAVTAKSIQMTVPKAGMYNVALYSLDGKKVANIASSELRAGTTTLAWNGNRVGSGMFLVSLEGNGLRTVRKMMIAK